MDTRPGRTRPALASFDDVYVAELPAVVRLAALLVRRQAVAEELAHDAFVRLFEHFHEVDNPPGFLRTVVVRLCLTWLRRHQTEHRVVRRVSAGIDRPTDIPQLDHTWDALGRLQPELRTVLVLRFHEQMRFREIADLLGCPSSTVRNRARRGLQEMRKELAR